MSSGPIKSFGKRYSELVKTVADTKLVRLLGPSALLEILLALQKYGSTQAAGYKMNAKIGPQDVAIIDEKGEMTQLEVHEFTNQIAHGLAEAGVGAGSRVAILCRNSRYFIEAFISTLKLGADGLLLNTAFAGPQLIQVIEDQKADAVIMDEEYYEMLKDGIGDRPAFIGWYDDADAAPLVTLDQLREGRSREEPAKPEEHGRTIILTSGTTGKPKGAARAEPKGIKDMLSVAATIPYRRGDRMLVSAPLFHAWGFSNFSANVMFSGTTILNRRFDPEDVLATIERDQVDMQIVVPVMLQRMLDVPEDLRRRFNLTSLRAVCSSGSALQGDLSSKYMDEFGDVLYNLYGSTEVAWATVASPEDMRAAPGTAGRAPTGTTLRLLDENGRDVPEGETGQVFVQHNMVFEGYTGGEKVNRLGEMSGTGDIGHLDAEGRLFIDGRIDEMIVSGGENVYPIEVENTIASHVDVYETAVIGVEDGDFGERLVAFVVPVEGAQLDEAAVKNHVKSHLASFKVPRNVLFLEEMPRNATGKIVKRDLHERLHAVQGDGAAGQAPAAAGPA